MTYPARRHILGAILGAACAVTGLTPALVQAAEYPDRPITMLVGYKAGGQTDLVGRGVARVLSRELGQPVNVVNKPGAGGALAAKTLQGANPDGYTLLFHANSVINLVPHLVKRADFSPQDFEYAGMITTYQVGLATQIDAPYDTLEEFITWARDNPGFKYGALSPSSRMIISEISKAEGLKANIVPLKGGGDMINAVLGNQVDLAFSGGIHNKYPEQMKMISALTTFRHPSSPDVATIDESGFELGMDSYTTLILPKGTPRAVLDRLAAALKKAEGDPEFQKLVATANIPIIYKGVDAAYAEINDAYANNKSIMDRAGVEPK